MKWGTSCLLQAQDNSVTDMEKIKRTLMLKQISGSGVVGYSDAWIGVLLFGRFKYTFFLKKKVFPAPDFTTVNIKNFILKRLL